MKKFILGFLFLFSSVIFAQNNISGTFAPAKDYSWLIAYRLKPGTQVYVADTAIKNGKFMLNIPANSPAGMYRLVYAVPQEEFYFDVIYNGKENIELSFTTENGVAFTDSKENILFNSYFQELNDVEHQIINYYTSGSTYVNEYNAILKNLKAVQTNYETKANGLIAYAFIKGNRPYIPSSYEGIQDFIVNKKKNYFSALDFTNSTLQASGFLTDKVVNYVFTALPLEEMTKENTEEEMQKNIRKVDYYTQSVSSGYRMHLFYNLWSQAAASEFNAVSDFAYNNYLKVLATAEGKQDIIDAIELHNRLRIGAIAPDISWGEKGREKTLLSLDGNTNYVLVFWSSGCSHCLKELPALHKELKKYPNTKVIAVGLEDNAVNWKMEITKFPIFEHALALGKWEGKYAKLYAINQTPSYFILDSDKLFIAKPEDDKAVVEFLTNN